ncbi:aspartate--ammonia ligase AsnA [Gottschalkia acidurici 9a]|uniref:Aspartate--ammonia ligase n=1 Tax=Gottschalkia acidurici (strain ATCC 7906 / DSM 604 / BCRC 14475 / CIP 104303 / KCTC 5404 / NCIMB 10678 / 9a) TaxID=1128398 RepID=K0AZV9_GOTA9|nr:aspartate--ammonia ligase [Gottschalkia acidurici]AFS78260.1 aspartate--ammonia ligase AsnA [Gottschalkia acidurici 9a]
MYLLKPEGYRPRLDVMETVIAIKQLKDFFESALAKELNLTRVSAPLFVKSESGLNDDLNGVEEPVSFKVKDDDNCKVEIVHSLAKWKRMALSRYGFEPGQGLYTDMNAIRPEEELDNTHSIYVDQWDWEKVIRKEERTEDTLINTVKSIFKVFKSAEDYICELFPQIEKYLPDEITFITSQELEDMYPTIPSQERENIIAKEKKAVFIMKIGHVLNSGEKHDGRAPDYDDWNLNGDIIFWNPILNKCLELSSMGIRVDEEALKEQLKITNSEERLEFKYHKLLVEGKLPYTIGGGIGQSRICMYFLQKAHIGEVQASIWPDEMIMECEKSNMFLL